MLTSIAIVLIVVALARPQWGSKLKEVKKKGVEIMLVVDVSNSMLAEDFRPNRLESTKYAINRLLEQLTEDRVGLIVFAGNAFVQLPITSDYVSAKSFVSQVSTDMINNQGTSIAAALDLARRSFSGQSDRSRAVVLISDGEDHEEDPMPCVEAAMADGIVIHAIGVGTPEGAPVVINGQPIKDENGNIVVSKLDETMLQKIALTTGGSYIRAGNQSVGLNEIVGRIHEMEKSEFTTMVIDAYNEQFQYVIGLALCFLLLEFLLLEKKSRRAEKFRRSIGLSEETKK